jgi:hypothetical protein
MAQRGEVMSAIPARQPFTGSPDAAAEDAFAFALQFCHTMMADGEDPVTAPPPERLQGP